MPWDNNNLGYGYNWINWGVGAPGGIIPVNNPQDLAGLQQAQRQMRDLQMMAMYQYPPIAPQADLEPEEGDMINDFKVGCDPEFMLLDDKGKTVLASPYFRQNGEIGYDHGGRVAEFRPGPSKGIFPIIKKIQALMKSPEIPAMYRRRAGAICNNDCLGGHVHFGFNCFTRKPPNHLGILQGFGEFNERGKKVTEALDALTKTLEHLDILPKNESDKRRASAQGQGNYYGAYGDVRDCHGHMEYRTMASWLYDPKVAFLCLTAAKIAAADPQGAIDMLGSPGGRTWVRFKRWLEQYKTKDINALRAAERLLERGLPIIQVNPDVDFRERWEALGL